MKKVALRITGVCFLIVFVVYNAFSQGAPACPSINAGPDQSVCSGTTVNLAATVVSSYGTGSYSVASIPNNPYPYSGGTGVSVNTDDVWSGIISLPFNFCYFGNMYNQCVLGSNGQLSFDLSNANGFDGWSISSAIPSTTDQPANTIDAVFRDIDPELGSGKMAYYLTGTAPCRALVVYWYDIPLYDNGYGTCDGTPNSTFELVLYENTNFIDVYVGNSYSCSAWNGGYGIIGIQNSSASVAVTPPNRNYSSTWTSTGEAWRFTPTGSPNYTVTWTIPPSTTPIATGLTATVSPTTTTTYQANMVLTNCDGSTLTRTDQVTVNVTAGQSVTVTASPTSICNGSSSTLTASGATSYSWAPSTGLSATTGTTVTANPTTTTTYTVSGSPPSSCSSVDSVTITVGANLTINASASPATICAGRTTTLTATGGSTYNWSPSTGLSATTGASVTANPTSTTTYTVTSTNTTGCTGSDTVKVTVISSMTPTVSTVNNVSCNGNSDGSLAINLSGGATPYSYSWNTSPAQTTDTVSNLSAGSYVVTVTDANGCMVTDSGSITQPTALDTSSSKNDISCYGLTDGTATINVSGGTAGYTYAWTPAVTTSNAASNLGQGNYSVTATDANGCTISKTFTIYQPPLLTVSAAGFDANCYNSCDGQAVVIPSGGTPTYHYAWSPGNGTAASMNNLCIGNYCITVTDANGCTADTCVTVNQPSPIVLDTSTVAAHCMHNDGSATVTASGGTPGYTYLWTPGGQTTATASNITPGQYCVTVTDAHGCSDSICVTVANIPGVIASLASSTNNTCYGSCDGAAAVTASGGTTPYTYAWSSNAGSTASVSNLCAGTYTCVVADAYTCLDTVNVTITQPDSVVVYPDTPDTICIGQSTNLTTSATGGDGIFTYTWSPSPAPNNVSPTVTTTYTVVATDTKNCVSAPKSITLNVRPPLSINATGDTTFCIGGTATMNAAMTGGDGIYTYLWNPGAMSGNPVSVSPTNTTTYTVVVNDNCGTAPVKDSVKVNVNPLPVVAFTADTTAGCFPLCVDFTNNTTPQTMSAAWDFGDQTTSDSINTASHCYYASGLYSIRLTVTDIHGCKNILTNNDMIDVYPKPHAAYMVSPQPTTVIDPTIHFKDQSTASIAAWQWSFGDVMGDTSSAQNPVFIYPDSGAYQTQLIVTNIYGCKDTANQYVYILPDYTLYVPNAFSPNGDGRNDVFLPKGTGIDPDNYQFYVFDRWGRLIFHTEKWGEGWDGRVNGNLVQEDVYVWKIIIKDAFHKKHQYIGHVSVIR